MLFLSCTEKPPSPCFIITFREKGRSLADAEEPVAVPHCPVMLWRLFLPAACQGSGSCSLPVFVHAAFFVIQSPMAAPNDRLGS